MLQGRGRWAVTGLLVICAVMGVIRVPAAAKAAPPAQGRLSFDDESPSSGSLDNSTPKVTYSFNCIENGVGSVVVATTAGDLAVEVSVFDPSGALVASGSQVGSNPNVSAAEAFVTPSAGTCTVVLKRTGSTSGKYEARLLPGYAQLDKWDKFDGTSGPLTLAWPPYTSDTLAVNIVNQQLQLSILTDNLLGYAIPSDDVSWSDFYVQTDVTMEGIPSYAEYGFVLRLTTSSSGDDNFYSFTFSTDGDYTVYYFDGKWEMIQDWTVSPVVDKNATQARLGLWCQGNSFRAYYNNQYVAEVVDTNGYSSDGILALAAGTGKDQKDTLKVDFDNLIITKPLAGKPVLPFGGTAPTPQVTPAAGGLLGMLGAATKPPEATPTHAFLLPTVPPVPTVAAPISTPESAYPSSLSTWNSTRPADVVKELNRLGLVPSGGKEVLNVPSSYGDTSASGWKYYALGQGNSYRNFVLGFDARQIFGAEGAGCGMFFRNTDSSNNDAVITSDGGALLGHWDAQGNLSDDSIFDTFSAVNKGVGATNKVIVVAQENLLLLYVNGQLVANAAFPPQTGTIALEMYIPKDDAGQSQETYCQLNNIWMWGY